MSSSAVIVPAEPVSRIRWPAIIAGAVAAAGVSFALHAFAAGIGLSVASTAPTWRDSSAVLWWLSGIYLIFAALCAFAVGGWEGGEINTGMMFITLKPPKLRPVPEGRKRPYSQQELMGVFREDLSRQAGVTKAILFDLSIIKVFQEFQAATFPVPLSVAVKAHCFLRIIHWCNIRVGLSFRTMIGLSIRSICFPN